ncbi:MAG TPA: mevalonate kinase [Anaerolineaceae bacterium]|nr:mevalonate kinase [Anaerolineaceae bacterium]HPN51076.1 mevalonate kinase [Anaerolineaceae bacterium]
MPAISAYAPGKIILFGEHAVVYGRPALAVPVLQVKARAAVLANVRGPAGQVRIEAPDIQINCGLHDLPSDHPFQTLVFMVCEALSIQSLPALTIRLSSTIPTASGLGSGAAISVAFIRALSAFLGHPLSDEQVNALAYETERYYHGSPSGIDNTVITYAMPVYFVRGQPIERLKIARPFTVVIGDTGIKSPTIEAVSDVRRCWQSETAHFESLFDQVGQIALAARQTLENGETAALGPLMLKNHELLCEIGVSAPALDALVQAAVAAGAQGAKLCGGGRGGNMIALVAPENAEKVAQALQQAGAVRTIITEVK